MQPPIQLTGNPNLDWMILAVGAFVALYWLRALRLAREGARLFLRNVVMAVVVFCFSTLALTAARMQPTQAQLISVFVGLLFLAQRQSTKRSRTVPEATKRAVIKRDLKGEKYDSKKHHIDHVWPFARGGSHTADNLRVIEKKKNLQKGAKRPRLWDMW